MEFKFATATQISFGAGALAGAGPAARELGSTVLVVTGSRPERAARLLSLLKKEGLRCVTWSMAGEPTIDAIQQGASRFTAEDCQVVVSIGGGSVVDAGKAIAALAANGGDITDYLEVIGQGKSLEHHAAPFVAIPTTSGTGAEVTRNAVLASEEHKVKVSLRSPLILPRLAIVDPDLTRELPPAITASTGLDALTQLIEPYVTPRANPLTDGFCREGIPRAAGALRRAFDHGEDAEAREAMSLASLLSGLALANSGLGAVHGFAAPIGGAFRAPHGAVCAALLPHVMSINVRALQARHPDSPALARYETVARWLTGRETATIDDGIQWVAGLCRDLEIPSLGHYGLAKTDVAGLVANASKASSMKANPIKLTEAELGQILQQAL